MTSRIKKIETFKIEIPREGEPYLGDFKAGEVARRAVHRN